MAKYLLIESRDPFESTDVDYIVGLAKDLKTQGNDVTLFLVQNGVLPARRSPKSDGLSGLIAAGVNVVAEDFSLRERGITSKQMVDGVKSEKLDFVIDRMAEGDKCLWH